MVIVKTSHTQYGGARTILGSMTISITHRYPLQIEEHEEYSMQSGEPRYPPSIGTIERGRGGKRKKGRNNNDEYGNTDEPEGHEVPHSAAVERDEMLW